MEDESEKLPKRYHFEGELKIDEEKKKIFCEVWLGETQVKLVEGILGSDLPDSVNAEMCVQACLAALKLKLLEIVRHHYNDPHRPRIGDDDPPSSSS